MSLATTIKKAKENPLQAFAWTLLTICVAYIVTSEAAFPDRADALEKANVEIKASEAEIDKAHKIVDAYREANRKIQANTVQTGQFVNSIFPNISAADIKVIRTSLFGQRQDLNEVLTQLTTAHFENERFAELFRDLQQNVLFTDDFLAKRITFIDLVSSDFAQAKQMRSSLDIGIEETRRIGEAKAREAEIDNILERARFEHNAKVRTAQRRAELYKTQSRLNVAAFTYIGGFIGGWGGFLIRKRRKGKDSPRIKRQDLRGGQA